MYALLFSPETWVLGLSLAGSHYMGLRRLQIVDTVTVPIDRHGVVSEKVRW